ncbi:MAG: 8-amino-7-oxononanoate synthase, partial [Gammaproteobacteria bacterium]
MKDLSANLVHRKSEHLYRSRLVLEGPQGTEVIMDGHRYLSFCGNDYLGLANHPDVIKALQQSADQYGVGSGAAHLVTGHSKEHHELEDELAEFVQRPRALLFSTGYMANLGIAGALIGRGSYLYEDRLNHASLVDAGRLCDGKMIRYRHADIEDLEQRLGEHADNDCFIASDGVFSMDGDLAPAADLAKVAKLRHASLWIDDAHGLGVLGANGRGTLELAGLGVDEVPILMGTLGKAFGTFGAFVTGSEDLIETLIQEARTYIYTTAIPAPVAAATRTSLRLAQKESWRRDRLRELIR